MTQTVSRLIVVCTLLCVCVSAATSSGNVVRFYQNHNTTFGNKILACYYTRSRRMAASSVPSNLCTHLIYAFGVMSPSGIAPNTPADTHDYKTLVELKGANPSLKVMISLHSDFSSVVDKGTSAMSSFSSSAVKFLKDYNFDGVDLDWEYPKSSQREAFSKFITIFSASLRSSNLLLSMALPNVPFAFNRGYDASTLTRYVDFMTAMTYDFHIYLKNKDNTTGYNSPLYAPKGESKYFSTGGMIDFYTSKGISPEKLLLGIPTYGRSWTLADPQRYGLHSPALGKGGPAPYSGLSGLYIYADVCVAKQKGAATVQDQQCVAEYLHHDTTWVAFESIFTVQAKSAFVRQRNLAGIGVWALQIDDAQNVCKKGPLPLINAIRADL